MDNKNRYQRIFFIFSPEDKGFGNGQEPSGYVKIELSEGKGKLLASVQSLRELDRLLYKLYLIRTTGGIVVPVCVGPIQLLRNRAELKWDFNPENVANTGFQIKDFNVAAIMGESKDENSSELVCPLAAYRESKVDWRISMDRYMNSVRENVGKEVQDKQSEVSNSEINTEEVELIEKDISSRFENAIHSKYMPSQNAPQIDSTYIGQTAQEEVQRTQEDSLDEPANETPVNSDGRIIGMEEDTLSRGFCVSHKTQNAAGPCENCAMNNVHNTKGESPKEGDTQELRQYFDKYFEVYDPFRSKRKDYKWWKVGSPVQLNNIMYQCNIKTPLLFNPAVMMAHFKYRHLIVGIYTDQVQKREYVVCGVPGIHRVDDKPFGDLCRWVQVEGNRPRYGAFGYWLVYVDGKSGKLLNIN